MSELSDFVSAFQAGYKMTKSKEEREWEKEMQQMKRDQHKWGREGDVADREHRDRAFTRQGERDAIGDQRYEQDFRANQHWRGVQTEQSDRLFRQREDALQIERDRLETGGGLATDDQRTGRNIDDWFSNQPEDPQGGVGPGLSDPGIDPGTTGAIPENAQNSYQPASYSPSGAGETAQANTGFNLDTYLASTRSSESGGRDDAANPLSSARGRYQFLGSTWNNLASKYPELELSSNGRFDGNQQERAMLRFTYDNAKSLDKSGIPVTNGNLYAAHFLGDSGARKALRANPNTPMARLVGQDVIKANPFLSGMTAGQFASWADKKGNVAARRKTRSVSMARGGMVSALPEDEEDDGLSLSLPEEQQVAETALPDEGPIPAPRYEGTSQGNKEEDTDDPFEQGRRAVRDGMKYAMQKSGASQPEAVQSPEMQRARERYARGYGAGDQQIIRQITDLIDPDKKMPPAARNLRAIGKVYQYYLDNGEYEKAQAAAGQMAMAYKQEAQRFKAIAGAAARDGDLDTAAKAAMAAYANVPTGMDLSIQPTEDGAYEVTVTDMQSGKEVSQKLLSPRDMAAAAMQMESTSFEEEILNAAGAKATEFTRSNIKGTGEVGGAIDEAMDAVISDPEQFAEFNPEVAEALKSPKTRRAVRDIAMEIGSIEENGSDPQKALFDAIGMLDFDPQMGEDGQRANWGEPFKAEKIKNSDYWLITRGDEKIRVRSGTMRKIEKLRDTMGNELRASEVKAKESAETRAAAKEKLRSAAKSAAGLFGVQNENTIPSRGMAPEAIPSIAPLPPQGGGGGW